MEDIDIMKEAYASGFKGSITALIDEVHRSEAPPEIAATPEQQQVGLTQGPPRQMVFPNSGGKDFNTVGMSYPIDMQGVDANGDIVQSYSAMPPGVGAIPFGPEVDTVIENPAKYQTGGPVKPKVIFDPEEFKRREQLYNDSLGLYNANPFSQLTPESQPSYRNVPIDFNIEQVKKYDKSL